MELSWVSKVKAYTQAHSVQKLETIQNLWSGYGEIIRISLNHNPDQTYIVKHVQLPQGANHPRGWNSKLSHQRKIKSYQVEMHWYQKWSKLTLPTSKMAQCLAAEEIEGGFFILLEDLDQAGFPIRLNSPSSKDLENCVKWLAGLHASFLYPNSPQTSGSESQKNSGPNLPYQGLWETGTYWHLETRPEELEVLNDQRLKNAASKIDQILKSSPYQTLVHGDAKLANFCFSPDHQVAAVDFQYIGHGCGMKDLAYFIGSCFHDSDCEKWEQAILDLYFASLFDALDQRLRILQSENSNTEKSTQERIFLENLSKKDLENNWRQMFPVAWTDFHRFLKGWSPGHWKIHSYSEQMSQKVLKQLDGYMVSDEIR